MERNQILFRSVESIQREDDYNNDLERLNNLLESNQKEYCEVFCGQKFEAGKNRFNLSRDLLEKLVYGKELSLSGNFLQRIVGRRLNDEDMPQLVDFLLEDNSVCQLNLPYNDFGDEALLKLGEALLIREDILFVNITHNNLTPAGCLEFVQYLMQRKPLHSLKLSGMKIGPEGFNGLICLIMCGRGPHDLDVGDTDIDVPSFQGLCSAWEAIDRDEDFPKYLTRHPLPISLEILAQMKVAYDDSKREERLVQNRRSLMNLLEPQEPSNQRLTEEVLFPPFERSVPELEGEDGVYDYDEMLKGLFDIPQVNIKPPKGRYPKIAQDLRMTKEDFEEAEKIADESLALPDTAAVVEAYNKATKTGCDTFDDEGKPVLLCPSLYSLDLDDAIDLTDEGRNNAGQGDGFVMGSVLEKIIENNQNNRPLRGTPDEKTATKAANQLINRAIQEAAQLSCTTDYEERSDISQLLLSILLDTCQKVREWEDSQSEFYTEDLEQIWNVATEQTLNVIQERGALEQCNVTQSAMAGFVRTFMESTKRTMMHMLHNPYFPALLIDAGTKGCREAVYADKANKLFQNPNGSSAPLKPHNIRRLVKSFVEGAVLEAAQLIGSGDPFSFRKAEPLRDALGTSLSVGERVEGSIDAVLDDFFLAGALLSRDAVRVAKKIEDERESMILPATEYVDDLFDQLAELLIATEEMNKDRELATSESMLKFPHISRPTRLVLNRPIFRDYEAIMSKKLGDFLQDNKTVKSLHVRKWDLGEDGMINLMEGLHLNTSLVLLDLGCNRIGPEGTKLLAKFVQNNSSLRHLVLNHNRLRDPGMRYLVDVLPESSISFLNVSYNDVTDDGLDILFETLPRTSIRSLYVIGNNFAQRTWELAQSLFESEWLIPEECDFTLQEVDGQGTIVKNVQIRDTNEWYEVPASAPDDLRRAPYFEENAHFNFKK